MPNAIAGLLNSRKAIIVLVIIAFCCVAVLMGKASWEQAEGLLWKIVGPYMIAQGFEDAAKHNAGKAPTPAPASATVNVSVPSQAPPAMPVDDG